MGDQAATGGIEERDDVLSAGTYGCAIRRAYDQPIRVVVVNCSVPGEAKEIRYAEIKS